MGFLDIFKKKAKEETKEEDSTEVDEIVVDDADYGAKVRQMEATLSKMSAQVDSLGEVRKSNMERFAAMTEQIGELRGQLMDTNKTIGTLEVKATRAADLVAAVHPDKLMIEIQKGDGKVEAVKANIESNEAMMHNIMDQIKKLRNQMAAFRGIEQVLKLNVEIKDEIMNIRKIAATVEKHSDKVETIFAEFQKTHHEYQRFADLLKDVRKEATTNSSQVGGINTKMASLVRKSDFEKRISGIEKYDKKIKKLIEKLEIERKKFKRDYDLNKKSTLLRFEKEFVSARVISNAFERMLFDKPELAKDLSLKEYVTKRKKEIDTEESEVEKEEKEVVEQIDKGEYPEEKEEENAAN